MRSCPVCNAKLQEENVQCPVCDTDLRVIREMDRFPGTFEQLAEDASQKGEYTRALTYLNLAQEMHPGDEKTLRKLAQIQEKTGAFGEALKTWQQVFSLSPGDAEVAKRIRELGKATGSGKKIAIPAARRARLRLAFYLPLLVIFGLLGWYGHVYKGSFFNTATTIPTTISSKSQGTPSAPRAESSGMSDADAAGGAQTASSDHDESAMPQTTETRTPVNTAAITTGKSEAAPFEQPESIAAVQDRTQASAPAATIASLNTTSVTKPAINTATPGKVADINNEAEEVSQKPETATKIEALVHKISSELPNGINIQTKDGGIFLKGQLQFSWQKQELENKAVNWNCNFVDLTALRVKSPDAIQYRIRKGDTLYDLARRFVGKADAWPFLFRENRDVISDPHKLAVGQQIVVYTKMP